MAASPIPSHVEFVVQDWRAQLAAAESSDWKEPIYRFLRPLLDRANRRRLSAETLKTLGPRWVLPERGFPLVARRRWGARNRSLRDATVLILGAGNGWEVASWAKLRPRRIFAADLYPFDSWPGVKQSVERETGVQVAFHQASIQELTFLESSSVDLIVSDAVLEHVVDLRSALAEAHRVLTPGGTFYATYGPLWYTAGGDHFSGRNSFADAFSHVLLAAPEYQEYFARTKLPKEDFQSGGRYVELDLFSKLTSREYLQHFCDAGFLVDDLILELSAIGLKFRQSMPLEFTKLLKRNPICTPDDFVIKSNFVRLTKAPRGSSSARKNQA